MRIDCGSGYVFNPSTGKCVKADGATGRKLRESSKGRAGRVGTCNGVVRISAKGLPHCSHPTKKKPTKPKSTTARGAAAPTARTSLHSAGHVNPVVAHAMASHARRRMHQEVADSLRLKLVEGQMQRQMKKTNAVIRTLADLRVDIQQLERRLALGAAQARTFGPPPRK